MGQDRGRSLVVVGHPCELAAHHGLDGHSQAFVAAANRADLHAAPPPPGISGAFLAGSATVVVGCAGEACLSAARSTSGSVPGPAVHSHEPQCAVATRVITAPAPASRSVPGPEPPRHSGGPLRAGERPSSPPRGHRATRTTGPRPAGSPGEGAQDGGGRAVLQQDPAGHGRGPRGPARPCARGMGGRSRRGLRVQGLELALVVPRGAGLDPDLRRSLGLGHPG